VKGALDVHQLLLARDVPHEIVRLRTRLLHADDLPAVLGVDRGCVVVRCYAVEREYGPAFAAVLVPTGATVSPSALLDVLDACSTRAAGTGQINAVTDYAAGLVSPICLPPAVELLADVALREEDVCYCALGEASVALAIHSSDLLAVTRARVAALTGGPALPGMGDIPEPTRTPPTTWRRRLARVRSAD